MHECRQLAGQRQLPKASLRLRRGSRFELLDLLVRAEAEDAQERADVGIGLVEEVLVEGERARHLGVQPDRAARGLPVLRPIRLGDQWRCQGMHGFAVDATDQVDSGREVAPLVTAACLEHTGISAAKLEVVIGLQDLVAELAVADASGLEPGADRLLGEHAADAEVLADVAQEVDRRQVAGPFEIVDDPRRVLALEREDPLDLGPDSLDPLAHDLHRVQHPLRAFA